MTFDEWWSKNWTCMTGQPAIMNLAFKEIAQNAWNAALEQAERKRQKKIKIKFRFTATEFYD